MLFYNKRQIVQTVQLQINKLQTYKTILYETKYFLLFYRFAAIPPLYGTSSPSARVLHRQFKETGGGELGLMV